MAGPGKKARAKRKAAREAAAAAEQAAPQVLLDGGVAVPSSVQGPIMGNVSAPKSNLVEGVAAALKSVGLISGPAGAVPAVIMPVRPNFSTPDSKPAFGIGKHPAVVFRSQESTKPDGLEKSCPPVLPPVSRSIFPPPRPAMSVRTQENKFQVPPAPVLSLPLQKKKDEPKLVPIQVIPKAPAKMIREEAALKQMMLVPLEEPVPLDDLYNMTRPHRRSLLLGEVWTVYVDGLSVCKVPKNLLMTASPVAQQVSKAGGNAVHLTNVSVPAVSVLLKWLVDTCQPFQAFRPRMLEDFEANLALMQAAKALGMDQYVAHIAKSYKLYLQNNIPEYNELTAIEKYATTPDEPYFTQICYRLAHLRYMNRIPDRAVFENYLMQHPKLAGAIMEIDAKFAAPRIKREAEQERRQRERMAQHAQYLEMIKRQKEEEQLRQAALMEHVRGKLRGDLGGAMNVQTMSAEEAALLRRR